MSDTVLSLFSVTVNSLIGFSIIIDNEVNVLFQELKDWGYLLKLPKLKMILLMKLMNSMTAV